MDHTDLTFREAAAADLPAILKLLADDQLGQTREDVGTHGADAYRDAFRAIDADPNHLLIVVMEGAVMVGTFQLSLIPGLARKGAWRGQIEAVRVAAGDRGRGIGHKMIEWAIAICRDKGCALVQLTSDKTRTEAQRFYASLGFTASHEGYKRLL